MRDLLWFLWNTLWYLKPTKCRHPQSEWIPTDAMIGWKCKRCGVEIG